MRTFNGFQRKVAVLVPTDAEMQSRSYKRTHEDGRTSFFHSDRPSVSQPFEYQSPLYWLSSAVFQGVFVLNQVVQMLMIVLSCR